MLESYVPVLLSVVVAVAFPVGLLMVTSLMGPRVKVQVKEEAYECGVPPVGEAHQKFPVKFYRVAIFFLLFDVEAALLWPWAVLVKSKLHDWGAAYLLTELFLFVAVLVVGYVYALKRGALEWD